MKYGKILGVGSTSTVYELEESKVLKLFIRGYPIEAVEKEFQNAKAISRMDFEKPKVYEIVHLEEQAGLVYDKVEGESLLDRVRKTSDLQECASIMAKVHKTITRNEITDVPNYKDFLTYHIVNSPSADSGKQKEILQTLRRLKDGNTLCHGDFHPGNIFISCGKATVIDFMNVCHGDILYDVARTVFLVEYTPVPADAKDREMIIQLKKTLADLYLERMNVSRKIIHDYLSVIAAARPGECPGESQGSLKKETIQL